MLIFILMIKESKQRNFLDEKCVLSDRRDIFMRNLAVVPVRSGSQRVRHKNIKLVGGHPLMYYQVECAKQVEEIHRIIVATDNWYYAEIAKSLGADVVMRPPEIATGNSKTEETVLYVIEELEQQGEFFDNVIILSATSPLNCPEYVREGISALEDGKYRSVLTYTDDRRFFLDDPDIIERPMVQDKKPRKVETGCFWITNIKALKKEKNRICFPCAHIRVSSIAALDIDTPEDLMIIEVFLKREMRLREGKYFRKRVYRGDSEGCYGTKLDPDGNIRNALEEKDKRINFCRKEIEFINNLYCDSRKRNLLDLGCGPGFVVSAINDNWNKYGLDVSQKATEVARRYISHVHTGSLESSIYPEEFFDLVLCHHVIEHVEDPVYLIKNIHRILKTHGYLIIATPNFDSGVARRFGKNYRLLYDETHISLFSDWNLKELLEDYGFQVDKMDYPFFETEYFIKENLLRLFDVSKVSPPFYGNIMTAYARKK